MNDGKMFRFKSYRANIGENKKKLFNSGNE